MFDAGEMEARIQSFDWSRTPIGPADTWSPALRTTIDILLRNSFPMLLWWGPEYISIYNDAYRPVLGQKHPWGLGSPVRECWSEIWHILKPLIDTPFLGGPATWMEDIELEIDRSDSRRKRILRLGTARCATTLRAAESVAYWRPPTRSPRRSSASGGSSCCGIWEPTLSKRNRPPKLAEWPPPPLPRIRKTFRSPCSIRRMRQAARRALKRPAGLRNTRACARE